MIIASSVPTLLSEIIKMSQDVASEARWIEYYAHLNPADVECIEDCVRCIMDDCKVILANIEDLKGEEI